MRNTVPHLILLFISAVFFNSSAYSQTPSITKKDTISSPPDSSAYYSFDETNFDFGNLPLEQIQLENYLDLFQNYHTKQFNLGNAGSPQKNNNLFNDSRAGFQRSVSYFHDFGYSENNRTFYSSEKPYTKIQYILGQKQEVNAQILHAHPFGRNCNIAFGFNRIRSTGFYKKQSTNNTSLDMNGWYRSPGKRYALLSDIYWTKIDLAENGGIKYDTAFEKSDQLDRQLVAVSLSSGNTNQRFREAWMKQYWAFGNVIDTLSSPKDSLYTKTAILPSWAISHTISIKDEVYTFYDKDTISGFFPAIYQDSSLTNDSTYLWKFQTGLWLERFNKRSNDISKMKMLSGKIGMRYEAGELMNDTIYTHYQNIFIDGSLLLTFSNFKPLSFIRSKAWYVMNGYDQNDLLVEVAAGNDEHKNGLGYRVSLNYSLKHPDYLYDHYSGNHYRWQNDLGQTGIFDGEVLLSKKSKHLHNYEQVGGKFLSFTDPIYFDSAYFLPVQLHQKFNLFEGFTRFMIGTRTIRSYTEVSWKFIPSNSPFHLPALTIHESFYLQFKLFKSALLLQTGIDATYFSGFFGDGYNPDLSQFQLQNKIELGNVLFLDPWVSLKIKPVRIFVKVDHVNAGFAPRNYYLVPHYPQYDLCLKFGVSWIFND